MLFQIEFLVLLMYNLFWLLILTEGYKIGNIREKYILLKYSVLMRIQLVLVSK